MPSNSQKSLPGSAKSDACCRGSQRTCSPAANLAAGEHVRWLPRPKASDLALPGNDFWLFDGTAVLFNHFSGDGAPAGTELREEPGVVKLCAAAFEAVWDRAVAHEEYRLA